MREVTQHYFVPENPGELESLVGRTVGINDRGKIALKVLYHGYEFLYQDGNRDRIIGAFIEGWEKGMVFDKKGFSVRDWFCLTYSPSSEGYEEKLKVLKLNNLWKEPTE